MQTSGNIYSLVLKSESFISGIDFAIETLILNDNSECKKNPAVFTERNPSFFNLHNCKNIQTVDLLKKIDLQAFDFIFVILKKRKFKFLEKLKIKKLIKIVPEGKTLIFADEYPNHLLSKSFPSFSKMF